MESNRDEKNQVLFHINSVRPSTREDEAIVVKQTRRQIRGKKKMADHENEKKRRWYYSASIGLVSFVEREKNKIEEMRHFFIECVVVSLSTDYKKHARQTMKRERERAGLSTDRVSGQILFVGTGPTTTISESNQQVFAVVVSFFGFHLVVSLSFYTHTHTQTQRERNGHDRLDKRINRYIFAMKRGQPTTYPFLFARMMNNSSSSSFSFSFQYISSILSFFLF